MIEFFEERKIFGGLNNTKTLNEKDPGCLIRQEG